MTKKQNLIQYLYKPDGTLTETPDKTLEIMEKSHFKDGDPPAHTNTNTSPDKHLSQIIYSESRMQEAISSFDPLKAAGPDSGHPATPNYPKSLAPHSQNRQEHNDQKP